MLLNIVSVVLVLSVLIFFHELGHFLIARLWGIGVKTFSLGFGPALFSKRCGMTEYRLSLIPLGGFVQLVGEHVDETLESPFTPRHNFSLRSPWQRITVIAAGPIFNFLLAWFIYWGIFWVQGKIEVLPHIGTVLEKSPAQEAGLLAGDMIIALNGKQVFDWEMMTMLIREQGEQSICFEIQRDGEKWQFMLKPRLQEQKNIFGETVKIPQVGISSSGDYISVPLGVGSAAVEGAKQTWKIFALTVQGLVKLVERIVPLDTVGGPILIAQMVSEQAHAGLSNLLFLTALISINLGFLNLLPIPILDGGHILFFLIEGLSGKTLNDKWKKISLQIGVSFLVALTVLAVVNDVMRLVR